MAFEIDLDYRHLKDEAFFSYFSNTSKNASSLTLVKNRLTFQSIYYLHVLSPQRLTKLNISWNNLGDRGCKYLSKCNLPHLSELQLNGVSAGDVGMQHLTKINCSNFAFLSMSQNKMTGKAIISLRMAPWTELKSVNLYNNCIYQQEALYILMMSSHMLQEFNTTRFKKMSKVNEGQKSLKGSIKSKIARKYGGGFKLYL